MRIRREVLLHLLERSSPVLASGTESWSHPLPHAPVRDGVLEILLHLCIRLLIPVGLKDLPSHIILAPHQHHEYTGSHPKSVGCRVQAQVVRYEAPY
eukprot:295048-Hanusia_phi.AAC.3